MVALLISLSRIEDCDKGTFFHRYFNLCMVQLAKLISKSTHNGFWKDIYFQSTNLHLSNIFFADDMVVFREISLPNVQNMLDTIDSFCQCSGQRIKFSRSQLIASDNLSPELHNFLFYDK